MDRKERSWVPLLNTTYVKVDHRLDTQAKAIAVWEDTGEHLDGFGFQINRNKNLLHRDKKTQVKGAIDELDSIELETAL